MISYHPRTEVLIFDLEAYVPKEDRKSKDGTSLAVNPYLPGHSLLGGVFYLYRPLTGEILLPYEHHWVWKTGNEKNLLTEIYSIFFAMRKRASSKKPHEAEPTIVGVGITHFDLPYLIARCIEQEIAPKEDIYQILTKFRIIDLASAGIPLLPRDKAILYPVSHNALANTLLPERKKKPTGKVVWEMADGKEYADIEKRCEGEVREIVEITEKLRKLKISLQQQ